MVHLKTYNDNTAVRKLLALATADVVLQSLAGKDLDSFTEHRWEDEGVGKSTAHHGSVCIDRAHIREKIPW